MMAENSQPSLNFPGSWIDKISILKSWTSILPASKRKHFESVLGAPEEHEEEIQEATVSLDALAAGLLNVGLPRASDVHSATPLYQLEASSCC